MSFWSWHLISLTAIALIILPFVTALVLRSLGNDVKQNLVDRFGIGSQVLFGGLGVIIHELAHLITAVCFLHQIGNVKLLEPRQYRYTGTLGYVQHYWNRRNVYESAGNFLVGLAPCYLCSEVLWLVHGLLFNNQSLQYSGNNLNSTVRTAIHNVAHPFGPPGWRLLIYITLIIMIASTGYGLSRMDLDNTLAGLPWWSGVVLVIYLLAMVSGTSGPLTELLWRFVVLWLTFLGRGLVYLVTALVSIKILGTL